MIKQEVRLQKSKVALQNGGRLTAGRSWSGATRGSGGGSSVSSHGAFLPWMDNITFFACCQLKESYGFTFSEGLFGAEITFSEGLSGGMMLFECDFAQYSDY